MSDYEKLHARISQLVERNSGLGMEVDRLNGRLREEQSYVSELADEHTAMEVERDKLKAESDAVIAERDQAIGEWMDLAERRAQRLIALESENEALLKDAERYRFIRTNEPLPDDFYQGEQCRELRWGSRLDDLIDAAMSKEP